MLKKILAEFLCHAKLPGGLHPSRIKIKKNIFYKVAICVEAQQIIAVGEHAELDPKGDYSFLETMSNSCRGCSQKDFPLTTTGLSWFMRRHVLVGLFFLRKKPEQLHWHKYIFLEPSLYKDYADFKKAVIVGAHAFISFFKKNRFDFRDTHFNVSSMHGLEAPALMHTWISQLSKDLKKEAPADQPGFTFDF